MASRDLSDEIKQLQRENFNLRKQIHGLSKQLNEQIQLTNTSEKDLHKFRTVRAWFQRYLNRDYRDDFLYVSMFYTSINHWNIMPQVI